VLGLLGSDDYNQNGTFETAEEMVSPLLVAQT
jgi:hypothetical protein